MYTIAVNVDLLYELGLNKLQAAVYSTLLESGEMDAATVGRAVGASRTNAYAILHTLEQLGLVEKIEKGNKSFFRTTNPAAMQDLINAKKKHFASLEQQVQASMPKLLNTFFAHSEKPTIQLLEGMECVNVFMDILQTREDLMFLKSKNDVDILGVKFFRNYRKRRALAGIKTVAITQDTPEMHSVAETDNDLRVTRRWIDPKTYNEKVDISVYGDKVAFVSFGEDMMGVIIQSPAMARSMRQVLEQIPYRLKAGANKR